MRDLFGLEGKRILVLGGGQGIGEATVNLLARLGAHVAIADLEIDRAKHVAERLGDAVEALPVAFDVLDDRALIEGIAGLQQDFGPLDGMATVIGMAAWSPLAELELETWDLDHRRNLRYFFVAAREVAKALMARQAPGSIVCVASVDGARSAPFHGSYGAAKAGLMNLVKSMTVEWTPHGIRANVVAPGGVITPRVPHMGEAEGPAMQRIPAGRRGTVEEMAHAIVFLLSDMARYISGQTLAVDGGFLAQYPFELKMPAAPQATMGLKG